MPPPLGWKIEPQVVHRGGGHRAEDPKPPGVHMDSHFVLAEPHKGVELSRIRLQNLEFSMHEFCYILYLADPSAVYRFERVSLRWL